MNATHVADTYTEPHWFDGRIRVRCTECYKVVLTDETFAVKRAAEISATHQPMKAYLGKCGHWHLSRIKRKR